jgi:hypothetical protein
MTNPLYTIEQLPTTSQAAIREFNDRYIGSIGAVPPPTWSDLGDLLPVSSPMITFPISSLALKYSQTEGESRFKTLLEKSFDLKVQEFDVGIDAKLLDIQQQVFAYRNWLQGPARMVIAEGRHRNRSIVTLLEAGENTKWGASLANPLGIDGVNFFSATHLSDFNDSGSATWSNYQVSTKNVISVANLAAEVTLMQGALDENGEKIGADPDTILVPTAKYEGLKNLLAQAMILENGTGSAGVTNPFFGRFNVVHVPEFTDADDWYLVDSKLRASSGLPPWLSARYTVPNPALELRTWDESSDYFKDTGRIKVSSHIWYGFSLGFPHSIRKVKGS